MAKLTQKQNREVPFELCFKYPLENGYTFKELTPENVKQFQVFLNKISQMTVTQVFRIHVVIEAGYYKIIRLDPKHKVHRN